MPSFSFFPANATDNYNFKDADKLLNAYASNWTNRNKTSFHFLD